MEEEPKSMTPDRERGRTEAAQSTRLTREQIEDWRLWCQRNFGTGKVAQDFNAILDLALSALPPSASIGDAEVARLIADAEASWIDDKNITPTGRAIWAVSFGSRLIAAVARLHLERALMRDIADSILRRAPSLEWPTPGERQALEAMRDGTLDKLGDA
jgi:hypothetical protein